MMLLCALALGCELEGGDSDGGTQGNGGDGGNSTGANTGGTTGTHVFGEKDGGRDGGGNAGGDGGGSSEATKHSYAFVRIVDNDTPESSSHPGADINAISVCKGASCTHASSVDCPAEVEYHDGAIGAPEPTGNDSASVCYPGNFASLNGTWMIAAFGDGFAFQTGDDIVIDNVTYEDCIYSGENRDFSIYVQQDFDVNASSTFVGDCVGTSASCSLTVP